MICDFIDDDGTFLACIISDLANRIGECTCDDISTNLFCKGELCSFDDFRGLQKSDSTTCNDPFIYCCLGSIEGIFDSELFLFHFDF